MPNNDAEMCVDCGPAESVEDERSRLWRDVLGAICAWNLRVVSDGEPSRAVTSLDIDGMSLPEPECLAGERGYCPACEVFNLETAATQVSVSGRPRGEDIALSDEQQGCVECQEATLQRALADTSAACICDPSDDAPCTPGCPVC